MAQKRKRNKKWIYWIVMVGLFVAAVVVAYLVWDNYFNDKKGEKQDEQMVEQVDEKKTADKVDADEEKDAAEKAVEQKRVEQYDGNNPNAAEGLSGVVTYAGVVDGKLMIRVNIDQYLDGGECRLTLVRGGASIYSGIAEIVGGASTASCAGFDVAVGELGGGAAEININLNSSGRSGTIHGEVDI